GVLRGILIAIVITIFGTWLLPNNLPSWAKDSQSLPQLQNMGEKLISLLPDGLEQQVTDMLKGGKALVDDNESPAVPVEDGTDETEDGTIEQPAPTVAPVPAT